MGIWDFLLDKGSKATNKLKKAHEDGRLEEYLLKTKRDVYLKQNNREAANEISNRIKELQRARHEAKRNERNIDNDFMNNED